MSGAEAGLVLGLISSAITIFETAFNIYETAGDADGLPKKIRFVAENIPLVHNALRLAKQNITAGQVTQEALESAKPVIENCETNATKIKDIFQNAIPTKDAPRAERLRKAVGINVKSGKVKEYMEEIFRSLQLLAQHQIFQDSETLKEIYEAVEQLMVTSDEDEHPQFTHSGTGPLNANTGAGVQQVFSNSGSGTQYAAQNQYFGRDHDEKPPPTICELPSFLLSPYFTGRDNELKKIDDMLNTSSDDEPGRCVIHGMPGLGKTQLALKFATLAFQEGRHPYVFWVSAASVGALTRGVSKLVDLLHLPGYQTLDPISKVTLARAWMEDASASKSWLFVLDNAGQDTSKMLRDVLPRTNPNGRLLVTTRTAAIAEVVTAANLDTQLALQPPRLDDAMTMLISAVRPNSGEANELDRAAVECLVKSVGSLPLAIDQAASYMRETGDSPQQVLDVYTSEEIQKVLSWENDLSRHEEKSVVATFMPALNKIQQNSPDTVTLLRLCCFCDPEGISVSIFMQGCEVLQQGDLVFAQLRGIKQLEHVACLFKSRVRLSQAIHEAQELSLVAQKLEGTHRVLRIHDLVHLLLRSRLMKDDERQSWCEIAIYIICKAFEAISDHSSFQNWRRQELFVSHFESLDEFADLYGVEDGKLLDATTKVGLYLIGCGLFERAAILYKRTLDKKEALFGEEHPSTQENADNLAIALQLRDIYEETGTTLRHALALNEKLLGEQHPSTLIHMNNLAASLMSHAQWEEGESLYRRTLPLNEAVFGEEHDLTLAAMNNLATVLMGQRKFEKAAELLHRTVILKKKVKGDEHPSTLTSMKSLAAVLSVLGRNLEATSLQIEVFNVQDQTFGMEHPETLRSMSNIALLLRAQGRTSPAGAMLADVYQMQKEILGPDHAYTQASFEVLQEWAQD